MKHLRSLGMAVLASLFCGAGSAQALELRFNNWMPPTHHLLTRVLQPYFARIAEVTDGRVTVSITKSSLGGLERQYEMAAMGVADITMFSESVTPGQFPLAEVVELPGLGENPEAVSVAYWRTYKTFFEPVNPYREVHLLGVSSLPPYHIYNAKRPVTSITDLQGLQLRASGILASKKVKALGATVIPAQITQFLELISKGVIDGAYFTDDGVLAFGFLDTLKYKTQFEGGLGGLSTSLGINKARWAEISPQDQAAISAISGEELARAIGVSLNRSLADAQGAMTKAGIQVTIADAALMGEVRQRLSSLETEWIAQANGLGVDGAGALSMLKAEVAGYPQ